MNVIVIGATSGIGRAVAEIYLAQGHRVGVTGRRTALLEEFASAAPAGRVFTRTFDVSSGDAAAQLAALVDSWPLSWRRWAEWISACIRPVSGTPIRLWNRLWSWVRWKSMRKDLSVAPCGCSTTGPETDLRDTWPCSRPWLPYCRWEYVRHTRPPRSSQAVGRNPESRYRVHSHQAGLCGY